MPVPVVFVCDHADLGGAERYLEVLLNELDRAWIGGVVVLEHGPFVDRLRGLGYHVEVVRTGRRLGIFPAALRLRRVLRRLAPRVIHANGVKAALLCVLATRAWRVPIVWLKGDLAFDGWFARWIARRCDQVVGVSRTTVETFDKMRSERIHVVHNGVPAVEVDQAAARASLVEEVGCPSESSIVVLSGRITRGKGQLELVEAAPAIVAQRPGVHFAFLGEEDSFSPGHEQVVRDRAAELGIAGLVAFLGNRPPDEALGLVSGADLLVAPSVRDGRWAEGFGLVGVEALAAGTPVVAYDSGALREVLAPCARIVPEGDRDGLAEAINYVLEDPEERQRITRCGAARVVAEFSVERAVQQLTDRYESALRL